MKNKKLEPKTRFIRVRCEKCKNEQNIFSNPSSKVLCLVCSEVMAESKGGRGKINAKILELLP